MKKVANGLLYVLLLAVAAVGLLGIGQFTVQEKERVELEAEEKRLAMEQKNKAEAEAENDNAGAQDEENIRVVLVQQLPVHEKKKIVKVKADSGLELLSYADTVTILEEEGLYTKIQTKSGKTGYVWSDCIGFRPDVDIQTAEPQKVLVIDVGLFEENGQAGDSQQGAKEVTQDKDQQGAERLCFEIADRLESCLKERGYVTVRTGRAGQAALSNAKRVELAEQIQADAVLQIQIDSREDPAGTKAAAYCMVSGSSQPSAAYAQQSRKLGKYILKYYTKTTGAGNGGVIESSDAAVLNRSKRPAVIVKMGDLSDEQLSRKMRRSKFQARMAEGMADGVDAYFDKK